MERTTTNRTLWIGLGILALLALIASSWGGGMMFDRGFGGPGPFGFGGAGPFEVRPFVGAPWLIGVWGFGLLIRLLFFGGLIFLAVRLFSGPRRRRYYRDDDYIHSTELTPGEILRRRYAAGEISREQYEDMRQTVEPTTP